MGKKKALLFVFLAALVVGLWIWTASTAKNTISIGGSASCDPILQRATNKYLKEKHTTFIYSSTGSTAGVNNMKNGTYKIGFISRRVKPSDNWHNDLQEWYLQNDLGRDSSVRKTSEQYFEYLKKAKSENKSSNIHYVNFALDSLVFVYNFQGTGFDKELQQAFMLTISNKSSGTYVLDGKSRQLIENIFAPKTTNDLYTWKKVAVSLQEMYPNKVSQQDIDKVNSTQKVRPYSNEPGSGTRQAFEALIHDNDFTVGGGANIYNNNGKIYSQILTDAGSFGYLSMNYAQYLPSLQNSNLAWINLLAISEDSTIKDSPFIRNSNNELIPNPGYLLTRPFNAIFSVKNDLVTLRNIAYFLFWLATDPDFFSAYTQTGLINVWVNHSSNLDGE